MDTGVHTTTDITREEMEKLTNACAEACGDDSGIIEKICPASEEQIHRMEHHIKTGSYMMQMVLHFEGVLDQNFLLSVLTGMRFKNHILRTRLVKYEGQVYQVILQDSLKYQQVGTRIDVFLAQNSQVRMGYGTPLLRHAFIQEPDGESFFVWSVHCCAVDNWTLRLIFDDLQTACSDVTAYCKLSSRPPYGRYKGWLESEGPEKGRNFWLSHNMAFDDSLRKQFPVLEPGGTVSPSTMILKKLLHLPEVENIEFGLPVVGHAAWALTIACLHRKGKFGPISFKFISMTSARKSNIEGIRDMMGPISARVPLRVHVFPSYTLEDLMRHINDEFTSMIGFEHCAMKALYPNGGLQNLPPHAVFSWNPPGSDLSSERIACHDKAAAPAVLAYREDLSVPYAHDYGLLFEVYEHAGHVAMVATWEPELLSTDRIHRLMGYFRYFMTLLLKSRGLTLREVFRDFELRRPFLPP